MLYAKEEALIFQLTGDHIVASHHISNKCSGLEMYSKCIASKW